MTTTGTRTGGSEGGGGAPERGTPVEGVLTGGEVKLVTQFNDYQRLVLFAASLLKKRGLRAHTAGMREMLEAVTTVPKAIQLLDAQNWTGYFPEPQQRLLMGRIQGQMLFMEKPVIWTGRSVVVEASCEHGNMLACDVCHREGRLRLDGRPY